MSTFNAEEKNLMLILALDFFAAALAGIFVTVYFFSKSDLQTTILYNIALFSTLLFFYLASGWTLKRVSSAFLTKTGLVSGAIFYLLLFILKEQSVQFAVPLGILSGFGAGNFWAGFNLNQYILTNEKKRVEYFGSMTGITNVLSALAPIIGGAIIVLTKSRQIFGIEAGYTLLFFIVFLMLAMTVLLVGKLPSHGIPNFSYKHIISHKRSKPWKLLLWQQALLGLYDTSLGVVIGILFFLIVKDEFALGTTQTIAYLLGAVGSMVSIRLLNKNHHVFWVGSLGLATGIGFCAPFLNNWLSTIYFKTMDVVNVSWTEKYHLMLERDTALGLSRILSFVLLFIFLQFGDQVTLAKTWLYFLPLLPLILGLLLWKMKPDSNSPLEALS